VVPSVEVIGVTAKEGGEEDATPKAKPVIEVVPEEEEEEEEGAEAEAEEVPIREEPFGKERNRLRSIELSMMLGVFAMRSLV
jgi:hypothetical protein